MLQTQLFKSQIKQITSAIRNNDKPPVFLLGAGASISSGIPGYKDLLKHIEDILGIDSKNLNELESHLETCIDNNQFTGYIYDLLSNNKPSSGYNYLESLIREKHIDLILSLNYDSLLEDAVQKSCSSELFRNYDCVSLDSERIAKIINYQKPFCKLFKLHGDLYNKTYIFSEKQKAEIREKMNTILHSVFTKRDLVIVGTQVSDYNVQEFIPAQGQAIWYVTPSGKIDKKTALWAKMIASKNSKNIVKCDFDDFMREIYLEIRKKEIKNEKKDAVIRLIDCVNEATRFNRGITRDNLAIFELNICQKIGNDSDKAIVLYIHDFKAPGGSEIQKRFKKLNTEYPNLEQHTIDIDSGAHRWMDRKAKSELTIREDIRVVIVVDSISFSGTTFRIVTDEIKKTFPNALIYWAPLLHSTQAHNLAKTYGNVDIISIGTTKSYSMWFPWGKTFATGPMENKYMSRKLEDQICSSEMRPWGTMYQFVHDEKCTVRILELKAEHKTSFHFHYNRDEFFVALDDNVGIEYYSHSDCKDGDLDSVMLTKGSYIMIPSGAPHRIFASSGDARVLEVSKHFYDQKHDLKRKLDNYGREDKLGDE